MSRKFCGHDCSNTDSVRGWCFNLLFVVTDKSSSVISAGKSEFFMFLVPKSVGCSGISVTSVFLSV